VRVYTDWLREDWNYVRFVIRAIFEWRKRAAEFRVSHCRSQKSATSMMTHVPCSGRALYNNGAFPLKDQHFGESYDADGKPRRLVTFQPDCGGDRKEGILPQLEPLQRWEISQPGNVLRVFERGGRKLSEVGNPDPEEDPASPRSS